MTETQKVTTDAYRRNWARVYKTKIVCAETLSQQEIYALEDVSDNWESEGGPPLRGAKDENHEMHVRP